MENSPPPAPLDATGPVDATEAAGPPPILVLVRDLMFAGRISATARSLNAPVTMLRDPATLAGRTGRRLIVDLNLVNAIPAAAAWRAAGGGEVVGFVSHVDTETIHAARAAGVTRVMARSQFVLVLPELLTSLPDDPLPGNP